MAKILLVEDETELAELVRQHLVEDNHHLHVAHDGKQALELFDAHELVILDVMLPGMDGFEVARQLRQHSSVPILMLTARASESDRVAGLEIGADDYLVKPFSLRELSARTMALLRRTNLIRESLEGGWTRMVVGRIVIDPESRSVRVAGNDVELTPREFELLATLAKRVNHALNREYLLRRIWGQDYSGSDRVVDTTVVRLRRKLGEEGERISSIWGVGYRLEG